jgi:hypothetical protein
VTGNLQNMEVRRVVSVTADTLTVDTAPYLAFSGASVFLCSSEVYADNSYIGLINELITSGGLYENGWLQIAGHSAYSTQALFNESSLRATLDYITYLNEDGADIQILTRGAAWEIHKPLVQAGRSFAVNDSGVMVRNAKSQTLTLNSTQTKLGYQAGLLDYGSNCVYIGAGARARNNTVATTVVGYEGTYQSTGTSPNYCTLIGMRAGYTNTGANVVAIGYKAAYGNTEDNVFLVRSYGASNYDKPVIKGYFATGAIVLGAPATGNKVADGNIPANRFSFYLDESTNKLHVRVCYANGTTYKTGEIALA